MRDILRESFEELLAQAPSPPPDVVPNGPTKYFMLCSRIALNSPHRTMRAQAYFELARLLAGDLFPGYALQDTACAIAFFEAAIMLGHPDAGRVLLAAYITGRCGNIPASYVQARLLVLRLGAMGEQQLALDIAEWLLGEAELTNAAMPRPTDPKTALLLLRLASRGPKESLAITAWETLVRTLQQGSRLFAADPTHFEEVLVEECKQLNPIALNYQQISLAPTFN